MNGPLREAARNLLAGGRDAMLVEVLDAKGSVPRDAGTRMVVDADQVLGTIGGGHLELQAIAFARGRLASGERSAHAQSIALGPSLGQCCGGALTLRYSMLDAAALAAWPDTPPRFALHLYGAGHVGRAIVALLAGIPCRVWWIDEREDEFPPGHAEPPHISRVCVEPVEAEVAQAPPGASFLVLTHSHDLDLRIAEAILRRGDFGFFGLIGSRTKRTRFVHRFEQRGLPRDTIDRMTCPIGVPGITGKEPAVIAVAVVAQLLQQASLAS